YHGGEEFTLFPMSQRRKMLQKMAQFGVNAIVCIHTHLVQVYEVINNVPVFYSLGNFIFDYKEHAKMNYTKISAILCFDITKNTFNFNFLPLIISTEKGIIYFAEKTISEHFKK